VRGAVSNDRPYRDPSITPHDEIEAGDQASTLAWIRSGAGLYRISKPATPSPHLVSYFVVVDTGASKVLLVDHKNARLWLPTGGHVEPDEHPRQTVEREIREELGIEPTFLYDEPLFVTVSETVGLTAGHIDVTLWYAMLADSAAPISYDEQEFYSARWFARDELPPETTERNLRRFLRKLDLLPERP